MVVLATMSGSKEIAPSQLRLMPFKRISMNRVYTFMTKCSNYSIDESVLTNIDSFQRCHIIDHTNMELLMGKFMHVTNKTFKRFVSIKIDFWC